MQPKSGSKNIHWVNLIFLSVTPVLAAVFLPAFLYQHGWDWRFFALFLVSCAVTGMSITGGYHRLFAHRSYEARPVLKIVYLIFGATAFQGSVLQWCADHRRHHRHVDTESDPHNIREGFLWAHIGWLLYKDVSKTQFPADLASDKWISFQHRHFEKIAMIFGFGLPALAGWAMGSWFGGLLWFGVLRVVVTNHLTFFINSLAHTVGARPYSDDQTARDSVLMALLGYGEGYHNYHHVFCTDYRNGIRWYHWDPTKWLIRSLAFFGVTYRLKSISPATILRARLQNDQRLIESRGIPAEAVTPFKVKVEEAQRRVRALHDEYKRMKHGMQERSLVKLAEIRAEMKVARLEFKLAWARWRMVRNGYVPVRAAS